MNDGEIFELLSTYQDKRKLYKDKGWELIHQPLKPRVFKSKTEKKEFIKKLIFAIAGQGYEVHKIFLMLNDNIAYRYHQEVQSTDHKMHFP